MLTLWLALATAAPVAPTEAPAQRVAGGAVQHGVYGDADPRAAFIAQQALARVVGDGRALFLDSRPLGGNVGLTCAACHPDGAATHAETFPKYVNRLQRVALLRDAINWCLANSLHGAPLDDRDPRLKALEAYLLMQRAGEALAPGRH